MNRIIILVSIIASAGCFDSIVDGPCASGYHFKSGECIANHDGPDAGPPGDDDAGPDGDGGPHDGGPHDGAPTDAGDGGTTDAPPDGLTCTLPEIVCDGVCIDVSSDPGNCGACNHVCASGICELGVCVGELSGHIVAIGHDYRTHNAAMARLLGNAAALGHPHDLGIARLNGTAVPAATAGTTSSLALGMTMIGRPFHDVALPATPGALTGIDVLIVDAQTGEPDAAHAAGLAWAAPIDALLQRGGVVIVLEGASGVGYRFADGAALYTFAAPDDATNTPAFIVDAADAVVQQVVTPYLAATTSAVFAGVPGVVATPDGAVVVHQTRY